MNADELREAYGRFCDLIAEPAFDEPAHGWSAELVLAHVIVGDRLIAEAAATAMAGGPASFDNRASLSEPYLRAIVAAAGDWAGLTRMVRAGADELIALAEQMTDEQAAVMVPMRIESDGQIVMDNQPWPAGELLLGPGRVHLGIHTGQLTALAKDRASA